MVKVVDIPLGGDGDGGVILPVAVNFLKYVHCSVAQDKG